MIDADFLHDILADPDADGPRLRYADWLTARGDPRGELIRAQCEIEHPSDGTDLAQLHERINALFRSHKHEWTAGIASWTLRHTFRRGFVEEVEVEPEAFLSHLDELFRAPIRVLTLVEPGRLMRRIAALPELRRLRALALKGPAENTPAVKALAYCENLMNLAALSLRGCGIGPAAAWALSSGPVLASVSRLDLGNNGLGDEGVVALTASPRLTKLDTLLLDQNRIRDGGALALANCPHLSRLLILNLDANPVGDTGREALETSRHLQGLADLRAGGGGRPPPSSPLPEPPRPPMPLLRYEPVPGGTVRFLAMTQFPREPLFVFRHREPVCSVAFNVLGDLAAWTGFEGSAYLWDAREGKWRKRARTTGHAMAVAFSPAGGRLVVGTDAGVLHAWKPRTRRKRWRKDHSPLGAFYQLAFSPDSATLAAATHSGAVALFSADTGQLSRTLTGHQGRVWALAYSPEQFHLLASGGEDGRVILWDVRTGQEVGRPGSELPQVAGLAFSPAGRLLVGAVMESPSTELDGLVLWDMKTYKEWARIATAAPLCVAFSPDGMRLAAGHRNGEVHVWAVNSRELLFTLSGHKDAVLGMAFAAGGRRLATCGADGRVCIWELDEDIPF